MPGTGHTEDISRPSHREKTALRKRRGNYALRAKRQKRNRRLEFQRLNYSLSVGQCSVSGSSNSNLITHLLGNLS